MGEVVTKLRPIQVAPNMYMGGEYAQGAQRLWRELDPFTQQHSLRVTRFVGLLGQFAKLHPTLVQQAQEIAFIHDVGKAEGEVKDRLFLPREQTKPEDLEVLKRHSQYGAERICAAGLPETYAQIILHHHEDNDGSGYPSGWTREETARELGEDGATIIDLLRIADSFDSMVNGHYALTRKSPSVAADEIRTQMTGGRYNKAFRSAFDQLVHNVEETPRELLVP